MYFVRICEEHDHVITAPHTYHAIPNVCFLPDSYNPRVDDRPQTFNCFPKLSPAREQRTLQVEHDA